MAPGGASTLVSYGFLNLTHRDGHESLRDLEPGRCYTVRVALDGIAHRFAAGYRVRVAIASACWPLVWPSPALPTLTLMSGQNMLSLPVRELCPDDEHLAPLPPPRMSAPHPVSVLEPVHPHRITIEHDVASGRIAVRDEHNAGRVRFERNGREMAKRTACERSIVAGDPLSARTSLRGEFSYGRAGQLDTCIAVSCDVSADATHFASRPDSTPSRTNEWCSPGSGTSRCPATGSDASGPAPCAHT